MTVEELIEYLGERRVHLSNRNPLELRFPHRKKEEEERRAFIGKPSGCWWGVGGAWIEWCSHEMPEWLYPYVYEVTPPKRLLQISSQAELEAFHGRYWRQLLPTASGWGGPEWGKVAELYDGIEINPYRYEKRYEYLWYYGWDCASGCAWKDASVRLMAVRKGDGYDLVDGPNPVTVQG